MEIIKMVKNFPIFFLLCLTLLSAPTAHAMRRSFQALKPGMRGFMPNVASRVAQRNSSIASLPTTPLATSQSTGKTLGQTLRGNGRLGNINIPTISRKALFAGAGLGTAAVVVYGTTKYAPTLPSFLQKDFFTPRSKAPTNTEIVEYLTQKKLQFNERITHCFAANTLETFKTSLNDLATALEGDALLNKYAQNHTKEFNAVLTNNPDAKFAAQPYELTGIITALKKAAEQNDPLEMFIYLKDILSILPGDLQNSQYVSTVLEKLEQAARQQEKEIKLTSASTVHEWNKMIEQWKSNHAVENNSEIKKAFKAAETAPTPNLKAYELRNFLSHLAPAYANDAHTAKALAAIEYTKTTKAKIDKEMSICMYEENDPRSWEEFMDAIITELEKEENIAIEREFEVDAQFVCAPFIPEQYIKQYPRVSRAEVVRRLKNVRNIRSTWNSTCGTVKTLALLKSELQPIWYYMPLDMQARGINSLIAGVKMRLSKPDHKETVQKEATEIK